MDNVPFFSFDLAPRNLRRKWRSEIAKVIDSGKFINGPEVTKFEEQFANAIGSNFALGTSNGFDGLVVALQALEIGPGTRVAVPAHTFIATWTAVLAVGATPVGLDVDERGLMNLDILESIASDIDAVIPVHLHGALVNMTRLNEIAKRHRLKVLEDASQAHLAHDQHGYAGTKSHIGVFSLYPTKNLGGLGDAAIITTQSSSLISKMKSHINYGSVPGNKYEYERIGSNKRLDSIQASVLSVNLQFLEKWNARRKQLANLYIKELQETDIRIMHEDSDSVFHHFCILVKNRDSVKTNLEAAGIGTEIHYPKLAAHQVSKLIGKNNSHFPIAESISHGILSLPMSPWHTDRQIQHVVKVLKSIYRKSHNN